LPAALAVRAWGRGDRPRIDRHISGAQVVHGTNYVVPPCDLPRVVSVYDCWFLRHPTDAAPAVRRAARVLRRAVDAGAVVHASSAATAAALAELLPGSRTITVPLGALPLGEPPRLAPIAELDGPPFIVSIGTLERRKNLPRLVRAFGQLAGEQPDVLLVLAGADGDDRSSIDDAVLALGPSTAQRVLFPGRVDDSTRSWLLHHAAVLAYPSLDEGFGFPLLDAMQAGAPIVASTGGSIPEVAGDAALLCDPDDVDRLAHNLSTVLSDADVRRRLVAAGLRRHLLFRWDDCAAGLATLYRRLVDEAV
jgi:glycosyltransferase involved in cell wall biosynthesis